MIFKKNQNFFYNITFKSYPFIKHSKNYPRFLHYIIDFNNFCFGTRVNSEMESLWDLIDEEFDCNYRESLRTLNDVSDIPTGLGDDFDKHDKIVEETKIISDRFTLIKKVKADIVSRYYSLQSDMDRATQEYRKLGFEEKAKRAKLSSAITTYEIKIQSLYFEFLKFISDQKNLSNTALEKYRNS